MRYFFISYAWERRGFFGLITDSGYGRGIISDDKSGFDPAAVEERVARMMPVDNVVLLNFIEINYEEWMERNKAGTRRLQVIK